MKKDFVEVDVEEKLVEEWEELMEEQSRRKWRWRRRSS